MRGGPIVAAVALAAACGAPLPVAAQTAPSVAYRLVYPASGASTVQVRVRLETPRPRGGVLVMPRAVPMGYGEQPYDAFVSDLHATAADGRPVAIERQEGPRWRLGDGVSTVTYSVDLRRMEAEVYSSADASKVRAGYAGLLGYSVFAYVEGHEGRATTLDIEGPAGWPVMSTLASRSGISRLTVAAADFYALADSQIVMGPSVTVVEIPEAGIPLRLLMYAEGPVDAARVARLAATAFTRVARYFGVVPFHHYTIVQELLTPLSPRHDYNFSMEHLDSMTSTLAMDRAPTARSTDADEIRFQFNLAHHIAHAWVPKRASGAGYFPFQWELAPLIDTIWFAEGFGQYAAVMAMSAGEADPAAYRERLLDRRFRQSIASAPPFLRRLGLVDLSRVASTRYSTDFRTGQLVFSRGGLLAAAIDDRITAETRGTRSLRDVLTAMLKDFGPTSRGFAVEQLPAIVLAATGVDVRAIYDAALEPLDP